MSTRPPLAREDRCPRCAGALLALGAVVYAIAVVLFVAVYGSPEATGPDGTVTAADRIAHYLAHQSFAHLLWGVEMAAAVLYATSSLVLQRRRPEVANGAAGPIAWSLVSVGAVLLVLMYPIMLGGYPAAAAGNDLPLFGAVHGIASFLFGAGNLLVFLGLALAFVLEGQGPQPRIPRWLSLSGAALLLIVAASSAGLLLGIAALQALAPLGLLGYALTAYLALRLP